MKQIVTLLIVVFLTGICVKGQASLHEYLQVVIEFTENNQNQEAIKLCDKLVALYPENADVYFLRGINFYLLKEFDKAITDLDKTLALNPDYPDAYLYRAKAKKARKNLLAALSDYNKAKNENFSQTVSSLAGDAIRSLFTKKNK